MGVSMRARVRVCILLVFLHALPARGVSPCYMHLCVSLWACMLVLVWVGFAHTHIPVHTQNYWVRDIGSAHS